MNLHIELDSSHPSYTWLEKQADKLGAKGHFGTHTDCYTTTPSDSKYNLQAVLINCINRMPLISDLSNIPSLEGKAVILYTGNMYKNDYGSKAYFDETDTSIDRDTLLYILEQHPLFILIDSYGIGAHGETHIELDKLSESHGCFVIENICITPEQSEKIESIQIEIELDYPSTGKPCKVYSEIRI